MTRDEIINEFTANIKVFKTLAYNIAGSQDEDDLFQMCSLMLLEFPEDRLISYYNPTQGLKPFFIRMLINQYKSKTSVFHKQYRKEETNIQQKGADIIYNAPQDIDDELTGDHYDLIKKACQSIYDATENKTVADLEQMIWQLYIEHGSLRKAVAAIPEDYVGLFDLKSVNILVSKFQRTIKDFLAGSL